MARRQATTLSNHTTSTRDSRRSAGSYDRPSTAATSLHDSPRPSTKSYSSRTSSKGQQPASYEDDLSYSTSLYPRSSVDTYSSRDSVGQAHEAEVDEAWAANEVPLLPVYRQGLAADTSVRPTNPEGFAALFPSMNRLSIRHDDLTPDGNMNLRVDTVVNGRRRKTFQLFHLRMHDLNKRDFSLRRYCRESGREVCHSKRKYEEVGAPGRPVLERSMSTVMQMGRPKPLTRTGTNTSMSSTRSRPGTSYSSAEADDELVNRALGQSMTLDRCAKPRKIATNSMKLEFSNYAQVDVQRCGSGSAKRYDFEWWGHKYSWKRSVDKLTGAISFHLMRDGSNKRPVAHIVPESRTPSQIIDDEDAGGWV
jgi:hypothetical protein